MKKSYESSKVKNIDFKNIIFIFLFVFGMCIDGVQATPGALRKNSIKTCSNGVTYGQHSSSGELHWHQAVESNTSSGWSAVGEPIYSDPCSSSSSSSSSNSSSSSSTSSSNNSNSSSESNFSSNTGTSNNSDSSNSSSSSNNNSYNNSNTSSKESNTSNNSISTSNSGISSNVTKPSNSNKADKKEDSVVSDNVDDVDDVDVNTEDKKEDSVEKEEIDYVEETEVEKSSDTSIKVVINDETVVFDDNKSTVYVSYSVTKVDFDYTLGDFNSTVVYTELDTINVGDNEIHVVVTAEDGTKSEYIINIYRYSKVEDFVYTVLAFGLLGGIGFAIYKLFSKVKKYIGKKSNK